MGKGWAHTLTGEVDAVTAPYRMAQTWMQRFIRGADGKREIDG